MAKQIDSRVVARGPEPDAVRSRPVVKNPDPVAVKLISAGRHKHTNPFDINEVFYPDVNRPTKVAKLENWHEVQIAAGVLKRVQ